MIPGNAFTAAPVVGPFMYLQDQPYTPLSQTIMGGVALSNGTQGRLVKAWTVAYINNTIQVQPAGGFNALSIPVPGVTSVSLAFDANMAPVIAWTTTGGANLYYYDTITATYITRFFTGVTSCKVAVDDPRDFYNLASDVMFGYTLNNMLYWRQQRDRYDIERLVGPTAQTLIRMGPSVIDRLQFQCL